MASTFHGRRERMSCRASSRPSRCRPLPTNCLQPTRACSPRRKRSSAQDATSRTSSSPSNVDNSSSYSRAPQTFLRMPQRASRSTSCGKAFSTRMRLSAASRPIRSGSCLRLTSVLRRFTAPTPWPPARALRPASASALWFAIPTRPSGVRKRERPSFSPAQPRARTTCTA